MWICHIWKNPIWKAYLHFEFVSVQYEKGVDFSLTFVSQRIWYNNNFSFLFFQSISKKEIIGKLKICWGYLDSSQIQSQHLRS